MASKVLQPYVLIICDGWGERADTDGNAIAQARTPYLDRLRAKWPHTTVAASGEAVGLPPGQMGNSEVGHLAIGAGRIIHQALGQQIHSIENGSFYDNEALIAAIELAKSRGTDLHLMGLVSPGDVHAHTGTAVATARLAKKLGLDRVHVHAFTDGRDTPPQSAHAYIDQLESDLKTAGAGRVASLSGRYYAMDRDTRWDRTEKAYRMLTDDNHATHTSPADYIAESYERGEHDEFLLPIAIATDAGGRAKLQDGDVVVFFNFRPDRARQLTHALVDADFTGFNRQRVVKDLHVVTIAEYDRTLPVTVAFPKADVSEVLAEIVSQNGGHQFHVAETEKYAHVTYFINGGREQAFAGEDRMLIPSPRVATYDLQPDMAAPAVTEAAVKRIATHHDDLIIINFANADMVGHTGIQTAAIAAIETVDRCVGLVTEAALANGRAVLITADHGNAELNTDPSTHQPLTAHTTSPVPVILCGTKAAELRSDGGLSDIAPTILKGMGLPVPSAMTGKNLTRR